MEKLNDCELKKVEGGVSASTILLGSAIVVFLIGIIDGFTRPLSCNQ